MRGETPERNIFLEDSGERKKIAFVHTEGAANAAAEDIARQKMTEVPDDIKVKSWKDYFKHPLSSIKKKSKQIWKHNIAREFYEEKYKLEARRDIENSGSLYINESGDNISAHDKAMEAIVDRYVEGAGTEVEDELIHKGAGESWNKVENEAHNIVIKDIIKGLVRGYAIGDIADRGAFEAERSARFARISQSMQGIPKEVLGFGVEYSNNLFKVAEMARDAVRQGVAVDRLDMEFDVIIGTAKAGARTEVKRRFLEKGLDWAKRSKLGFLANETTLLAATAIVTSTKKIAEKLARSRAAAWLTFGGSAAVGAGIAGLTENKRLKEERAQIARERFKGKKGAGENRDKFKSGEYTELSAVSAMQELRQREAALDADPTIENFNNLVNSLAEVNARINISDFDKIDLIGSHSDQTGEEESLRRDLDRARARARVKLRRVVADTSNGITLTPGVTADSYINDWIKNSENGLRGGEISAKDQAFNEMKRWEVGKKMALTFGSGVAVGTLAQQSIAWGKDLIWGDQRPETALEHGWHAVKGVFKRDSGGGGFAGLGAPHETSLGFAGNDNLRAKIPLGTHIEWQGDKFSIIQDGTNQHLVDGLELNPDHTGFTQQSIDALKNHGFGYTVEQGVGGATKSVFAQDFWKDKLDVHKRVDWHDEPGKRYSEFFHKLIEFEGKQQMLYLKKDANGVYMDVNAVYNNLAKNAQHAFKIFGKNPDGSVDSKLQHLVKQLETWHKNGTLQEHLQGVIIPTDEANKQGLSMMFEGATNGKIYFNQEISNLFSDPKNLKDGKLPFKFLEFRLDGHTLATAQGKSLESILVPTENPIPVVTPPEGPPPPHEWRLPDFVPINGRTPLERIKERAVSEDNIILPSETGPLYGYGYGGDYYGYGDYEGPDWVPAEVRRKVEEARSETLKNDPKAKLDHFKEIESYFAKFKPEYKKQIQDLARELGIMKESVKAVVCIPVAGHQEHHNIYRSLENYTTQKASKDSFEIVLFVNNPTHDKETGEKLNSEKTLAEIERFKRDHPEMQVKVMHREFQGSPRLGMFRKMLTDTMLARHHARGENVEDLIIISNDADNKGVSEVYIDSFVKQFDKHPEVEGLLGKLDWDPESYLKMPEIHIGTRLFQYLNSINRHKNKQEVYSSGANFAYKSSMYAAVGGYVESTHAGEDIYLGYAITAGRQDKNAMRFSPASRLYTSSRRAVAQWKNNIPPVDQWRDFNNKEDVRNLEDYDSLPEIDYSDPEQVQRVKYSLESVIDETLNLWAEGGKDFPKYKRALALMGIQYQLDADGRVEITNMDEFALRLSEYQKSGLAIRDRKMGRETQEQKVERNAKKEKRILFSNAMAEVGRLQRDGVFGSDGEENELVSRVVRGHLRRYDYDSAILEVKESADRSPNALTKRALEKLVSDIEKLK